MVNFIVLKLYYKYRNGSLIICLKCSHWTQKILIKTFDKSKRPFWKRNAPTLYLLSILFTTFLAVSDTSITILEKITTHSYHGFVLYLRTSIAKYDFFQLSTVLHVATCNLWSDKMKENKRHWKKSFYKKCPFNFSCIVLTIFDEWVWSALESYLFSHR